MKNKKFSRSDIFFMKEAISTAKKALGNCSPNPNVGAVIVKNDSIIGKGFTQKCGLDHAEIQALNSCKIDTKGSTLYVTLEPCCHQGKTGPCTEKLISAGVKRVFIGMKDPNPLVNGKGIEAIKKAGIEVYLGLMEREVEHQLEHYVTFIKKKRPFVIMKNAVSLDGNIAAFNGESKWITNKTSRKIVHKLRSQVDAVLTTINTVRIDNPVLNVRLYDFANHPLRVIIDKDLDLSPDSNIFMTSDIYPTLIIVDKKIANSSKINFYKKKNIEIEPLFFDDIGLLNIDDLLKLLYKKKISSIMLEAGSGLNSSFLQAEAVDKIFYFIAPKIIGRGLHCFNNLHYENLNKALNLNIKNVEHINGDLLLTVYPKYKKDKELK